MARFLDEFFWHILVEVAPFLLGGLLLAGILKVLIPDSFVRRLASRENRAAPVLVSLAGVPLPLCSCSVLPFAVSLKRQGASRGSVLSFLAATPQTGVDSIAVSYGFFGLPFALFKLGSAFVSGSLLGIALDWFGRGEADRDRLAITPLGVSAESSAETCGEDECSCVHDGPQETTAVQARPVVRLLDRVWEVFRYAFDELLGDFAGALAIGVILSAAVTVIIPAGSLAALEPQWLYYPAVLLVSMPLYICSTSSVPLAFALVSQGLPAGAALVLLIAGPATNFATVGVALKTLGRRATTLYVAGIAALAVGSGLIFDFLLPVTAAADGPVGSTTVVPLGVAVVSAISVAGLVTYHVSRQGMRRVADWLDRGGSRAASHAGSPRRADSSVRQRRTTRRTTTRTRIVMR